MNFKIEKIREAELQIDKLVAQEKKMRRTFLADGTIDKSEQQQLDSIEGKIAKLKGAVAKIRAEIEAARRAWEGRGNDYARFKADLQELADWGHVDHSKVKKEAEKIPPLTTDQQWSEATTQLDAALKIQSPVMDDYRKQVAAKAEYDPLRADTDTSLMRAADADPMTPDIDKNLAELTGQIGVIDNSLGGKDYVTALATLKGMQAGLSAAEQLIQDVRQQKSDYDKEMAELAPRLKEAQGCVFAALADKHAELGAGEAQISAAIGRFDYVQARSAIAELAVKVGLYMAEYATVVDAQTLYQSRLPRIDSELGGVSQCRFADLTVQQQAILDVETEMRGTAGTGSFEQAIEAMDKLDPLIEAFKRDEETARLGEEYNTKLATITPRMEKVQVCNYAPLEELQGKIAANHSAAQKAASDKKYTDGLALLGDVEVGLGDFEGKLIAQEAAQTDYENRIAQITTRFQDASSCEYPQLSAQAFDLIAIHDRMAAAATGRDFAAAVAALNEFDRELGIFETTMEELRAKQLEYETRQPPLAQRFDAAMVSDYTQLEDERDLLQTARADMEAAAGIRDFPLAMDHLNAVERMLNDLDAQAGNLDALKQQYQAILAKIEPGLASADACEHEELTPKKAPILEIRADMLALAQEEDFGLALERANSLIPLLTEFAKLEVQVEDYRRRLDVLKPRMETVKTFTYKSLKERQDKIATLFAEMTAQAAKAELTDALKKMDALEKLVSEIIKLNEELKLQEAVYKKLHGDLKSKMAVIEGNKIEKPEVKKAAEAAKESWKKFEELGGKDEYIEAVKQADDVQAKIEAFRAAVDKYGDAKEAFEMLRDMAKSGYEEAQSKAEDYEDLEGDLKTLKGHYDEMTKAGEGASPDYDDAKAKAQKLLDALKAFDGKWVEISNREAAVTAEANTAYRRLEALPKEAAEKAEDDYDDAKEARRDLEKALTDKKLERAEQKVKELNDAIDRIEGALKTKEEHKIDYDARLALIQPRVDDANKSKFKAGLTEDLKVVNEALTEMTDRGEAEDYEGGVKAAPTVEAALGKFNDAEDKLEQIDALLIDRIGEIKKDLPKLEGDHDKDVKAMIDAFRSDYAQLNKEYADKQLKEAEETSQKVRDQLRSILDKIEELEDAGAKAEEDKGLGDRAKDLAKDVAEEVYDRAKEEALDYVDGKVKGAKNFAKGAEELWDGEVVDGVIDIVKGVDDLMPIPVSKTARRTAKVAEEVYDFVKGKLD